MKRYFYFFCLLILISLQSCFDIVEQLALHTDGSGNFQLTVNLSRSKTQINMFQRLGGVNGHKLPSKQDIRDRVAEIEKTAVKTPGISAVKTTLDFNSYIASIALNFTKVTQVNAVVENIVSGNNGSAKPAEKYFDYDAASGIFTRSGMSSLKEGYKKMSTADKTVFTGATYTSVYRFDAPIESRSNASSNISPSKKAILLRLAANDILKNRGTTENTIKLAN